MKEGIGWKLIMGRDRELKWLAFSLYPLSFFLYSPFKQFDAAENRYTLSYLKTFKLGENDGIFRITDQIKKLRPNLKNLTRGLN